MNKESNVIVGWGLAGAVMAWQMYFKKYTPFMVYDSSVNHSSRTAAGIVNPIVFKRLTKSWKADILMPYAETFYEKIEKVLGIKIINKKQIYKVFTSFEEENNWVVKQEDDRFKDYLCCLENKNNVKFVTAPFGYGIVNSFGSLDTNLFLDASKAFFIKQKIKFISNKYDYAIDHLSNGNYVKNIIFCEGVAIEKNPYFHYLPLKPTHGETLTIEIIEKDFNFKDILNKNLFLMHIAENKYKVGATYNWSLTTPDTTEKGKNELIEKLNSFTNFKYNIISHDAGIRPTVKDRRPLIGTHPSYSNLHVFNGLGTKGVMIAPYYSDQFLEYLINGKSLDKEVNINRYNNYLS
jgi:hypothetical protein